MNRMLTGIISLLVLVACKEKSETVLYDWDIFVPYQSVHYKMMNDLHCPGMRIKTGHTESGLIDEQGAEDNYYSVFLDGVQAASMNGNLVDREKQMITARSDTCEVRVSFEFRPLR